MTESREESVWRAAPWLVCSIGAQSGAAAMLKVAAGWSGELPWLAAAYVGALALLAAQAVCWLQVLGRMDLARAYPFMALVIPLNLVFAAAAFGEVVSPNQLAGIGLIVCGVALVAKEAS